MKSLPVTLSKTEFQRGLGLLLFQQFILPALLIDLADRLHIGLTNAHFNFLYFLINYAASIILFRKFLWAELDVALGKALRVLSSVAISYGLYYVLSTGVAYLVEWIDPAFFNLNDANIGSMSRQQFALTAVGTVILVPPAEELLFRGVLFNKIYQKRPVLAWFISIVSFSLVHLIGYIGQYTPLAFFLAFLQYIPAGVALCFGYVHSGTIFTPILFHTLINAIAMYYQFSLSNITQIRF